MRQFAGIIRKELDTIFSSPIFYAAGFIFLIVSGYFFYSNTVHFEMISLQASKNPFLSEKLNLADAVIKPLFGDISIVLLLMLPLITMRLYSDEKKTGTIELFFTYPVSDVSVLVGKFCATVVVLLTMLVCTLPYLIILEFFGNIDWGLVFTGYLGTVLMASGFIALGIFTSALTENQIVAAVLSFGALLLLWMFGWARVMAGPVLGPVMEHLSIIGHLYPFTEGIIDTRDIVFYLLFTCFWLFLTLRFLSSRYWRS